MHDTEIPKERERLVHGITNHRKAVRETQRRWGCGDGEEERRWGGGNGGGNSLKNLFYSLQARGGRNS